MTKIMFLNTTLSCISKCLKFLIIMFNRKILLALIVMILLNGCTSPSAMIGPVYTLSSTGNTFQAGLSYGSNELITQYTGKTPIENLTELRVIEENETQNIKKKTLESEDFYVLIKNKIDRANEIFKPTNQ